MKVMLMDLRIKEATIKSRGYFKARFREIYNLKRAGDSAEVRENQTLETIVQDEDYE